MSVPLIDLVERNLAFDGVDEYRELNVSQEDVRDVADLIVSSRIPNVQSKIDFVSLVIFYRNSLAEILQHVRLLDRATLHLVVYKCFDDAGLADAQTTHYDDFRFPLLVV